MTWLRAYAKPAAAFVGVWLLVTLLWGLELANGPHDWARALAVSAVNWLTTAVVAIPIALLAWYVPFDARAAYRAIPMYAVAIAAASLARFAMFVPLHNAVFGSAYGLAEQLRLGFVPQAAGMVGVAAVVTTIRFYRDARERELRASRLQSELTEARMIALQSQMHPHFLFNTLHAVSTLMHRDVEAADEMLVRLCDLLRLTLERPTRTEITLGEELAILERYVEIMELRFPHRLYVRIEVPQDVQSMSVPPLLLQPLIENVLRHGLDESDARTEVIVAASRENGMLTLRVIDNGRGISRPAVRAGIGLENTRRRLETLYGSAAALSVSTAEPKGTQVLVTIPAARSPQ